MSHPVNGCDCLADDCGIEAGVGWQEIDPFVDPDPATGVRGQNRPGSRATSAAASSSCCGSKLSFTAYEPCSVSSRQT
jgi:hypothetical protein